MNRNNIDTGPQTQISKNPATLDYDVFMKVQGKRSVRVVGMPIYGWREGAAEPTPDNDY